MVQNDMTVASATKTSSAKGSTTIARDDHSDWIGLKLFTGVLSTSSDAFGPLKQAIDAFTESIDVYEAAAEAHEEYRELRAKLDELFHDLSGMFGESLPPGIRPSIVNLARYQKGH
ncbi:hypothetical protein FRC07_008333 [Ceratobasidium sp. 392]|nr:hypothetical protein FRC07_008333 [Ceratobasidium sp. 392]